MAGDLPFDVQGARDAGYSDDQIIQHLSGMKGVNFDVNGALKAGYSPTQVLDHLAPQPSGIMDNLRQGAAETLEGVGKTIKTYAGEGYGGDTLTNAGKSIAPENFVASPIYDKSGFHGSGILPSIARAAPAAAGAIVAAGLAPEALGPLGAIGAAGATGMLANAGNEAEATGSKLKGAGLAGAEGLVSALPVTRFLRGSGSAIENVGAKGVGDALKKLGITTADQGAASAASDVIGQEGRSGTVDPTQTINAGLTGAATAAPFAGTRVALPEALDAAKYGALASPEMRQAATQVANRIVANAGGDASALQGRMLLTGGAQKLGADAVNKTRAGIQSELSDAVSNIKTPLSPDAQNVLKAAQSGMHPDEQGYQTLAAGLGNDPQSANVLNLLRQNQALDSIGGYNSGDKLSGGFSGLGSHILTGEHIGKSAMVGLGAAAFEEGAGHVIAYSPQILAAYAGAKALGRIADNLTGAQAPAGRFVRNFADGQTPVRVGVQQPTTAAPAAPVGPTGPSIAPPPSPWARPAPTGPATPPVAGGSIITPNIRAQMDARATLAKLAAANAPQPSAASPVIDPNRLPTSITAPARSIMRGAAMAQKLQEAPGATPMQMREASDLMAARRANAKLQEAQEAPAPAPEVTPLSAPLPQAKGSIIPPGIRAVMNARTQAAKVNAPKAEPAVAPQVSAAPKPEPAKVSKANGQTKVNDEPFPASSYAHLPDAQAVDAIMKQANIDKSVKFAGNYRKGVLARIQAERALMANIGKEVPALEMMKSSDPRFSNALGELRARLEGRSSQTDAKAFREHIRESFSQLPQLSDALDKYLSDEVIKQLWKKVGK